MPNTQIEVYEDTPPVRQELAEYLVTAIDDPLSEADWQRSFEHWWDENPFADLHAARGWTLRQDGHLAGFLALIPVAYAVNGQKTPALAASTWVMDPGCRNASLPMFMKLQRLGREVIIADTTPSPEVQALMDRSGWRSEKKVTRRYFPALRGLSRGWPAMPGGTRIVTNMTEVRRLARPFQHGNRIEKWVTPESLRWQLASPMHGHRFLGVIDDEGVLTSYVVLVDKPLRGIPAWLAMEAWTARETHEELHAMIGAWLKGRVKTGLPWKPLLSANAFSPDPTWVDTPALHARPLAVCHYFKVPEGLATLPKHTVMAEGDLAL